MIYQGDSKRIVESDVLPSIRKHAWAIMNPAVDTRRKMQLEGLQLAKVRMGDPSPPLHFVLLPCPAEISPPESGGEPLFLRAHPP